jgi:hypothetical protein
MSSLQSKVIAVQGSDCRVVSKRESFMEKNLESMLNDIRAHASVYASFAREPPAVKQT